MPFLQYVQYVYNLTRATPLPNPVYCTYLLWKISAKQCGCEKYSPKVSSFNTKGNNSFFRSDNQANLNSQSDRSALISKKSRRSAAMLSHRKTCGKSVNWLNIVQLWFAVYMGNLQYWRKVSKKLQIDVELILFPKPKTNLVKSLRWIKAWGRSHD